MMCWQCVHSRARHADGTESDLWRLQKRLICTQRRVREGSFIYNPKAVDNACKAFEVRPENQQKKVLAWMKEHGLTPELLSLV